MEASMCEHGTDVMVSVKIPADLSCDGQEKWKDVGIDACIAPIVKALQDGGVDIRSSCCGHGRQQGHIDLQDGRGLLILSPQENTAYLSRSADERRYPCGCSAVGGPNLPASCPEHGEDAILSWPRGADEERLVSERHIAEWDERLKPHHEAIRESERITRADLDIIVRSSEADAIPPGPEGATAKEPICYTCGEPKSKHTKKEADWRDVPGCTGHYSEADASPVKEERDGQ
jgi:hypothetical protein